MSKKDSTNSSSRSGTFEVEVFKAINSLFDRVTALEKSEKSTSDSDKQILTDISHLIHYVRLFTEATSNSDYIEQYSRSILHLSAAYKNFK